MRIERWCQPQFIFFLFKFLHKRKIVFTLSEQDIFFSRGYEYCQGEMSLQKCFTEIKQILENPFTYRAVLGICPQVLQNVDDHKTAHISGLDEGRISSKLSVLTEAQICPMYPSTTLQILIFPKFENRFMGFRQLD